MNKFNEIANKIIIENAGTHRAEKRQKHSAGWNKHRNKYESREINKKIRNSGKREIRRGIEENAEEISHDELKDAVKEFITEFDNTAWGYDGDCGTGDMVERFVSSIGMDVAYDELYRDEFER